MLFPHQEIIKSYSNQTGKFPIPSSHGNHYVFVLYHKDTNSVHAEAILNCKAASIRDAWEMTHKKLVHLRHPFDLRNLDYECSQYLKDAFAKYNVRFQRVPPKARTWRQCCRKSHPNL
jgi:hypothetical protein